MTNLEVSKKLRDVAAAYILKNKDRFRIIAYERLADLIAKSSVEIEDLWKDGKLSTFPGIGSTLSERLDELFRKGKVKHFEEAMKGLPESLFPLLDVQGFGPKRAFKLVTTLKLNNPKTVLNDLFDAAKAGKIAPIEGFGEKSQTDILKALEEYKKGLTHEVRMPLLYADAVASDMVTYLKKNPGVFTVLPLGSLRRKVSTIGDIDLAVSTNHSASVIEWFLKYPWMKTIVEKGDKGATIALSNGKQIDLRVQNPSQFGTMLQYFTGSKEHNIKLRELALQKGFSLSEYGLKPLPSSRNFKLRYGAWDSKKGMWIFSSEERLYESLGLSWIPPELRENTGEIERAEKHKLPQIVTSKDIKGDFHIHTSYDLEPSHDLGASPLIDILHKASDMGYEYIGISDHNPSVSNHTDEDINTIMKLRKANYEHILSSNKSIRVKLFVMLETDILPSGELALPKKAFDYIDATIVSIHSSFAMDKETMTRRILTGLSHPKAKILAHPTGRLLGKRDGYQIDWEKLFKFCKENNKAIEINSNPDRLDLPDMLVKRAVEYGVKLVINSDSHDVSHMDFMPYGVSVARRGWAEKADIWNTMPYNKVVQWLTR